VQAVAEVMDLEHKGLVDLEGEEQLVAVQQHLELLIQEAVEVAQAVITQPAGVDLEL
jgi:hypothetical protein